MLIQEINDILAEYDSSEKSWWQRLFGPPSIIKKMKLFLARLSVPPLPIDLARELTDEEMFELYHILLSCEKPEIRKTHGLMYEQEQQGKIFDQGFEECLSFSIKNIHVKNAARIFYKNFQVATLETLENKSLITRSVFTAIQKHRQPEPLRTTIEVLKDNGLLNEPNVIMLTQHPNLEQLSEGLLTLSQRNLLVQSQFEVACAHANPVQMAKQATLTTAVIRRYLSEYDKNKGFFRRYIYKKEPSEIAQLKTWANSCVGDANENRALTEEEEFKLCRLFSSDLFSRFNYANKSAKHTFIIARLHEHLHMNYHVIETFYGHPIYDLMTLATFKRFKSSIHHFQLIELLKTIRPLSSEFVTQEVFDVLLGLDYSEFNIVQSVIYEMVAKNIATIENLRLFAQVLQQPNTASLLSLRYLISNFKLFNQANFAVVARHPNPNALCFALYELASANLLTQAEFDDAVSYAHFLGDVKAVSMLRTNFSDNSGSLVECQDAIREAIRICKEHEGTDEEILNAVVRTFSINLNHPENTHTASVHITSSQSATQLLALYGNHIDSPEKLTRILSEMREWINTLSGIAGEAAQRAFTRLQSPVEYFVDPTSHISNLQLLALSWLAIHDETRRAPNVTLEETKTRLGQALYETQRGNNLVLNASQILIDDGQEDNFICASGIFNKLIEKLYTVHTAVEVSSITYDTAMWKFPVVVQEEVLKHVTCLRSTMEPANFEGFLKRLRGDNGIDEIWPDIEKHVHSRMLDEYGLIFATKDCPNGDVNHPRYKLILTGLHDVDLEKVSALTQGKDPLHGSFWTQENPDGSPKLSVEAPIILLPDSPTGQTTTRAGTSPRK